MREDYASGHSAAFSALNATHFGSASASLLMASCGHSEMQTPQSMQVSGSTTSWLSPSRKAETGQTSTQDLHLMQESLTTETINLTPS